MRGITSVRQLSRRYRSLCLQIRRLSLRRQLFFRPFILTGLLSSGLAHFSRTNKNFEAEVSSENREGSAHIELITFGTYRTLATWLPLRPGALLLLTAGVYRLRCNAARTLGQRCSAPPSSTSTKALQQFAWVNKDWLQGQAVIQQALCYPPEGLVQHLDLHGFMRVASRTVCCSRRPGAAANRGGERGPCAKTAAARSGGPAGAALALPGPHPGALSIPGLL